MDSLLRVLIVEDSEDDTDLLVMELESGGFDVAHRRVDSAEAMRAALDGEKWDLVISDYSMPDFSGKEAMKILRERSIEAPFIFVSGTIGEDTAIAALKSGAQDYVIKGNLNRLVPAIRRELRDVEERQERKRLEMQVRLLQRFEAIGRLAAGIAHDFNNVIGAIMGWAEIGYTESPAGSLSGKRFLTIQDQAARASNLTRQILAFARRQFLEPKNIDLNALVSESVNLLEKVIGERVHISTVLAPDLESVWADPTQIEQVLTNLCINARDAMPGGGKLMIETTNVDLDEDYTRRHPPQKAGPYIFWQRSQAGRPEGRRYGFAANWAAWVSRASRAARSRYFPFKITAWIFWVLWMSVSGLASSRTRSARWPGAMVPCSLLRLRNSAGLEVAAWRACIGVRPA